MGADIVPWVSLTANVVLSVFFALSRKSEAEKERRLARIERDVERLTERESSAAVTLARLGEKLDATIELLERFESSLRKLDEKFDIHDSWERRTK